MFNIVNKKYILQKRKEKKRKKGEGGGGVGGENSNDQNKFYRSRSFKEYACAMSSMPAENRCH